MGDIRILTVIDHYYPGWKAGGPVRAIQHLVAHLGHSFAFDIVTSDRDLGDRQPYSDISTGSWQPCGNARVLRLSPSERSMAGWRRVLGAAADGHLVYLNSLFSSSTIRILTLRRMRLVPSVPYLLAPRGELQSGALSLKPARKAGWLRISRALRLYEGVQWQAATPFEQDDIRAALGIKDAAVHVAPDVPVGRRGVNDRRPAQRARPGPVAEMSVKRPGRARVIFISRISRKKNLDYALRVLSEVSGEVDFDIYGPIEDGRYWRECVTLMDKLPSGVRARYRGTVLPDEVVPLFGQYDLFFFPTRGESYGHVVGESLRAGCPVLISDRTPWGDAVVPGAGCVAPLERPEEFARSLETFVRMEARELSALSQAARSTGSRIFREQAAVEAHRQLFIEAARYCPSGRIAAR